SNKRKPGDIPMLKFVRTMPKSAAAQMVERWLNERFGDAEGVCYYKHPAIVTRTGVIPDFILFTKTNQPLVIKVIDQQLQDINYVDEDMWLIDNTPVDSPILELEDLVLKLKSKFLDQRKLRNLLTTHPVLALPFITKSDFEMALGSLQSTLCTLW